MSSDLKVKAVSLAAPAYNEAAGIEGVLQSWIDYLEQASFIDDYEIVICNDGSKDTTGAILDNLASKYPRLKPQHLSKNAGAAAALTHAIAHTTQPWVFLLDSDGQYGIDNLPRFIEAIETSSKRAAIGVRKAKHDSLFTRFGSAFSGWLCNLFHGSHYRDFNCALKLVDGSVLRALHLEARGLNYSGEVSSKLLEMGIVMTEVLDIEHLPRTSGRSSSQNLKAAWHRLLFVMYIGVRQFLIKQAVLKANPPDFPCQ